MALPGIRTPVSTTSAHAGAEVCELGGWESPDPTACDPSPWACDRVASEHGDPCVFPAAVSQ